MKEFFTQFFTWWNGQTLGTRYLHLAQGPVRGQDEFGNKYYRCLAASDRLQCGRRAPLGGL